MSSILDYIDQGDPNALLILDKELAVGSFGTVYAVLQVFRHFVFFLFFFPFGLMNMSGCCFPPFLIHTALL